MIITNITKKEKSFLRDLAKKQLDYSRLPIMYEREVHWYKHNDLQGGLPIIHFETETCERDLLPPLECIDEAARIIELQIRRELLNHETVGDDRVIPSFYRIPWIMDMHLFNIKVDREFGEGTKGVKLGFKDHHPIIDLPEDIHMLTPSIFGEKREKTLKWKTYVEDILGDILPVRLCNSFEFCLSQYAVNLMGMENMLFTMMDNPALFKELLDKIYNEYVRFYKWLESEGFLVPNNGNDHLSAGSFGFTNDLRPCSTGTEIALSDLWLHMDSQETLGISPDMFGEFFFPYYSKAAKLFGLVSYGCCEPVHAFWNDWIRRFQGLRKISVSPWCNEELIGEMLHGSGVIYHRKPSPNFLGLGADFDEAGYRQHIMKTIRAAKGNVLEFSIRNIYTLDGNIEKPARAVRIIREIAETCW